MCWLTNCYIRCCLYWDCTYSGHQSIWTGLDCLSFVFELFSWSWLCLFDLTLNNLLEMATGYATLVCGSECEERQQSLMRPRTIQSVSNVAPVTKIPRTLLKSTVSIALFLSLCFRFFFFPYFFFILISALNGNIQLFIVWYGVVKTSSFLKTLIS